ncbi:transcriptional regulator with XRE-family HTH domain [Cytobacillus horneckiae]|uniref:helix-turn-helix domain-containing protein n=1 Tax=Cytobacillus horneckiae TaxID=549687 RepID=UPI0019D18024|nr:helix-turn-helix transcriptional regulator [Cytobacillus horneckiae]MBN6886153.1 helix-turn-helix transcriptional regulator [Cytobacillus horneckiae]MCM3176453.1 helix-turn-helix transcriptional regulator [Cytobacillus horneckiae]
MISQRLKEIRKQRGLTQEALAQKVNTKKTTISNYETGYSTPSNEMLVDLAQILNTSVDYLLGISDNENYNNSTNISLSPEEIKVFEEFKKYPMLFNDIKANPEKKIKEIIILEKAKKLLLEDDDD